MRRIRLLALSISLVAALLLLRALHTPLTQAGTDAIVLYDSALGTLANAQGWTYIALNGDTFGPPLATQAYSNGVALLDSMPTASDLAGYSITTTASFTLDRSLGYRVTFATHVLTETHTGSDRNSDGVDDRAGWSLTVIGNDLRGIELGFWPDRIWAQAGGTAPQLFTQAEGVTVSTTSALITYTLAVLGDVYTLSANNTAILTGPVRDYTAFAGLIDPYETPNLIALSDNTTSARAAVRLAYVSVGAWLYNRVYLPFIARNP